jgi:hypothetical protein
MLDKIEEFVGQGKMEKAFRWLGFVQGCFWTTKQFSIYELRDHNVREVSGD